MQDYAINTEVSVGDLRLVDVDAIARSVTDTWFNQSLCRVNDCVIRLGVVQGEFHWHKHDLEDEFFFVVDGRLFIDLDDRTWNSAPSRASPFRAAWCTELARPSAR